jgi:O-antigen ligase
MFLYQRPLLLLYLWPISILLSTIFVESAFGVAGVTQRSIWLLPMDPAYFLTILYLGLYASLHPKPFVSLLKEHSFLSVFIALVTLYILIYAPIYGKRTIGEARKFYFMFLFPVLALVVVRTPQDLRRFIRVVIFSATLAALYTLALGAMRGTVLRVVDSDTALIVTSAAFAMLIHRIHKVVVFHSMVDRLLLFLFAGLTMGSGHRSVWLAAGLGLLLLLLLHSGRRVLIGKIVVVGLASVIVLGTFFIYFPEVGARLGQKFLGILNPSSDDTASWRIEGWDYQLEQLKSSGRLLFGQGLGNYYWWEVEGTNVGFTPHNGYVQLVLKFGLFGLVIYGLLVFEFFRRVVVSRKVVSLEPMKTYLDMGMVNFGAGHGYMLGYGMVPDMLVFFAVAVCAIELSKKFDKVLFESPVLAGRLRRIGWQADMRAQRAPIPRYER